MDWTSLIQALIFILGVGAGYIIKPLVENYSGEKGKNLATKEDIKEITDKIEEVRSGYTKQIHIHQLAFDKEFEILLNFWTTLIELENSTKKLVINWVMSSKGEDENKRAKLKGEYMLEYIGALTKLTRMIDNYRPFYPEKFNQTLDRILEICRDALGDYSIAEDYTSEMTNNDYLSKTKENGQKLEDEIKKVERLIRERLMAD